MDWPSRFEPTLAPGEANLLSMTLLGEVCAGIGTCPTTSLGGEEEEGEEVEERIGLIRYQGVRSYAWVLEVQEEEEDVLSSLAK